MAHKITGKLRGLAAALVAVFAALALVPATAFADPWTNNEPASITVTGVRAGDTVDVYQVATIDRNATTNETHYTANTTNFTEGAVDTYLASQGNGDDAAALVAALQQGATTATTGWSGTAEGTSVTTGALHAGVYYVKITPAESASYTYQPMVVKLEPVAADNGAWTIDDVTVSAKSTTTNVTKTVYKADGTTETDTANYGDKLTFHVTFNIGQDMNTFEVTDTMNGLEYVANSLHVYQGNDATGTEVASTNYTVTPSTDNSHGLTIKFNRDFLNTVSADTEYTAVYQATVCSHAKESGATNSVETTTNGTPTTVDINFGKAGVFKFEKDNENKPLSGAKFQLFKSDGTTPIHGTDDKPVYVITDTDGYGWTNTNEDQEVLLAIGDTVVFKEVSAPSGYKMPSDESNHFEATVVKMDAEAPAGSVKVPNEPSGIPGGIGLPTTGGMGTVAFTAAGVVIMAGAAAFIVRSRKQSN